MKREKVKVPKGCKAIWGARGPKCPVSACVGYTRGYVKRIADHVGFTVIRVAIVPLDGRFQITRKGERRGKSGK